MGSGVLALVVARDRGALLDDVLAGIAAQTLRPDSVLLLDCSADSALSADELAASAAPVPLRVLAVPGAKNLAAALTRIRDDEALRAPWWWILHDDSIPEPACLAEAWEIGDRGRTIGAVGPKQMSLDGRLLLEVGIRATRSARRLERVGPDEIDQGQYDATSDVLAVGTAGMLVRAAAYDAVGGLDTALGPFGDGLDFGRRLHRAGFRVVVAPRARVRHARASYLPASDESTVAASLPADSGSDDPPPVGPLPIDEAEAERPIEPGEEAPELEPIDVSDEEDAAALADPTDASFAARRFAQLYNWAKAVPGPLLPLLMAWLVVLTPARALARGAMGRSALALPEFAAWARLVGATPHLLLARSRAAKSARVPASVLRPLESKGSQIRDRRRHLRRALALPEEDREPLVVASARAHQLRSRAVLLTVLLVSSVLAALAWWTTGSTLAGGAWRALPPTFAGLWESAFASWVPGADGYAAPADPFLVPLALVAAPLGPFGVAPPAIAKALLFLAAPASALTAWRFVSRLHRGPGVRGAAALAWSALPALALSQAQGRLAPAVFHVLLPLAASAWIRLAAPGVPLRVEGARGTVDLPIGSRTGGLARFALVSALLVACVPWSLLVVAVALALLVLLRRTRWGAAVALLPSLALIAPTLIAAGSTQGGWRALLTPSGPDAAVSAPPAWALLLGLPSANLPTEVLVLLAIPGALLLVGALLAVLVLLVRRSPARSRRAFVAPIVLAASALVLAAAAPLSVADAGLVDGRVAAAWTSPALSLGGLGLLASLLLALPTLPAWTARGARRTGALAGVAALVLAASASAPVAWRLLERQSDASLTASERLDAERVTSSGPLVAAVSAQAEASSRAGRVLVLDANADLSALDVRLWRGEGPSILDSTALTRAAALREAATGADSDDATASLRSLALTLVVYPDAGTVQGLADHGVDTVLVRDDSEGAAKLAEALDRAPGVERIGETVAGTVWRVRPDGLQPARARLVTASGWTDLDASLIGASAVLPEGSRGTLVLAERADAGWVATLDGKRLEPTTADSWAQAFAVDGSGTLVVSRRTRWELPWEVATLASLGLAALIGLPWRRRA
ncbi:glycosyltransferase [Actinomyces culturomici]|uniref:glycosyltransferase n=1 Tax=Actinomyces culturomici TaxID=1926276 RepID=UPI0015AD476F|nr:glycosyltransferase [Actinomyces culturomici]